MREDRLHAGPAPRLKIYLPKADRPRQPPTSCFAEEAGGILEVLVEDTSLCGAVTAEAGDLGYRSSGATLSIVEALRLTADFDLLFTDVMLIPVVMNGRTATGIIRATCPSVHIRYSDAIAILAVDSGISYAQPYSRGSRRKASSSCCAQKHQS